MVAENRRHVLLASGYITDTLASYFVGSDAAEERRRLAQIAFELAGIRSALQRLADHPARGPNQPY